MTTTAQREIVRTRRGIEGAVEIRGGGPPLVWIHGMTGLADQEPTLDELADRFTVYAPEWPGFGEQATETELEDMGDFTLHGLDLLDALELDRPALVGHSMGGMIAAEMAAANPTRFAGLGLIAPLGLWDDACPIPDVFAMVPYQVAETLFADPSIGERHLSAGLDFADDGALQGFMIRNARRLGTAGKILFPIPNRRLAKRLYRVTAPTVLVWGTEDRYVDPSYAEQFRGAISGASVEKIAGAGHMVPYERPTATAAALVAALGGS